MFIVFLWLSFCRCTPLDESSRGTDVVPPEHTSGLDNATQYPSRLRQMFARYLMLCRLADYRSAMVTYLHASRAVQRAHDFLAVIRAEVTSHAR